MSFPSITAQDIRAEVEELIEMVSNQGNQTKTAYEIEGLLWWKMLSLARLLMQLFFTVNAEQEVKQQSYEVDGIDDPYVGQRERTYVSLFGEVKVDHTRLIRTEKWSLVVSLKLR